MSIISFLAGLGVGAIIGVLVYRNNAKKIEREAKRNVDTMKYELDRLRRMVGQGRKLR